MNYVQTTADQQREMLAAIGAADVDELYGSLPQAYRLENGLAVPPPRSEMEVVSELARLGAANRPAASRVCFLGGGAYDHFIPASVDALAGQSQFVTAYTPYQAEASQGALQAFFEFQTQICRLTGMDVANASLYEGASATAEAALQALNVTGKRRLLVASTLHPHYRQVLRAYLHDLPAEMVELEADGGRLDPATVRDATDFDTAALIVASPNVYGLVEDLPAQFEALRQDADGTPGLGVAVFNPIACALFRSPGACGADVAVGEGQPLGIPLQYGGPYLGIFAARKKLLRKMPGRLVGQTVDASGRRGFCLTLQTREQHIRGAKATSNVCTNQGLLALRATIYLSAMGGQGLRQVALHCYHKAHEAARRIAVLDGYALAHDGPYFHEFVVDCPVPASRIIDAGRDRGIAPGLDCARLGIGRDDQLLVAVTEKRTAGDIDALVDLLREAAP
ncbi:MAG: aminomethyl-transferring glycine dehydrogenase [Phycisphaeraceae bacterium]|nr:aminomethyl-transferring glycine dehydrogenase [Phycisphaeraceae bacterium]